MGPDRSKWSLKDVGKRNRYLVKATTDAPNMITDPILPAMLSSPEHTLRDVIDIFKGMVFRP
ncbi:hypothetical protein LJK88_46330 [Paenibacillus sp. P26]|nr:hypothetical protein LJK88_46330 [Paenibacillus sp. P26]UUZ91991.1 hypothetical protein LJK87_42015 [Paenibacillus sp. P25]